MRPLAPLALTALLLTSACAVGPDYQRPTITTPTAFKAPEGWRLAQPSDGAIRGDWWSVFGDATLGDLMARAEKANQTLAAAEANYRQARAATRETRAGLFPTVSLSGSADRSGGGNAADSEAYAVGIGASWEPDFWGRIRRGIEAGKASEQAGAADLANARLSIQGELAINYFGLRESDAELALLDQSIAGYERALEITRNRYNAGIAPKSDVLQAETSLANARSERLGLERTRTTYENAVAVLVGEPASSFTLATGDWTATVPDIPAGVPSALLERRPDIASAERAVAAANAQIGVQQAAFFPTVTLTGNYGQNASRLGDLFAASTNVWSLGLGVAQTLFDAGARKAAVEQARAAYDAAVATYRQTVLEAFQDVENQLTATDILRRQYEQQQTASRAADQTETMLLNQYKAGTVAYTDVVTAQASALSARRTLLQRTLERQTTAVALIQSVGGGWSAAELENAR